MKQGRIVELEPTARIFASPQAEYTRQLLAAVLDPDPSSRPQSRAERELRRKSVPVPPAR